MPVGKVPPPLVKDRKQKREHCGQDSGDVGAQS
jgi:hypothetical protein